MIAYSTHRPVSIGTYPHGSHVVRIENFDGRRHVDGCRLPAFGLIEYDVDLSEHDLWSYDLESPELNARMDDEALRIAAAWVGEDDFESVSARQSAVCKLEGWDERRFEERVDRFLSDLSSLRAEATTVEGADGAAGHVMATVSLEDEPAVDPVDVRSDLDELPFDLLPSQASVPPRDAILWATLSGRLPVPATRSRVTLDEASYASYRTLRAALLGSPVESELMSRARSHNDALRRDRIGADLGRAMSRLGRHVS